MKCPICGDLGGFHLEEVHLARPIVPAEKLLPITDDLIRTCRACGEPLDGPGEPGCRYPNHGVAK